MDLTYYRELPYAVLPFDAVEAIGLDGTGRDADDRAPYTWNNLTGAEREKLQQWAVTCERCGGEPVTDTQAGLGERCIAYNVSRC